MRNQKGVVVVALLLFMVFGAVIGAVCWPYTINTWLVIAGKHAAITWWQGSLIGFVPYIGQLSIPAAIVTWIATLFL